MQSVLAFNAHYRSEPVFHGARLQAGDRVAWRNPATGQHFGDLRVEFVYPVQRTVLLRGDFGRIGRNGGPHIESKVIRLEQVTLEARAGERV